MSFSLLFCIRQPPTTRILSIHFIIHIGLVLHVSFNPTSYGDDPFLTIFPTFGYTRSYTPPSGSEISMPAIYLHGHFCTAICKFLPMLPTIHFPRTCLCRSSPYRRFCPRPHAIRHANTAATTTPPSSLDAKMHALVLMPWPLLSHTHSRPLKR